jgi:tRNA(Ile)-lysidine synthetase-like protein
MIAKRDVAVIAFIMISPSFAFIRQHSVVTVIRHGRMVLRRVPSRCRYSMFQAARPVTAAHPSLDRNRSGKIDYRLFASRPGADDETAPPERPNNTYSENDGVLRHVEQSLGEIMQHVDQHGDGPIIVLLGLSGGCDSVGLLHALVQILSSTPAWQLDDKRRSFGVELHAVHFDHKQRGDESDGDRAFVEDLCERLGVPLHTYYWESGAPFSQDIGRTWRRTTMYALLQSLAPNQQQGVILTAHHKDDSMESLLLKLLRGVHITNLSGMEPCIKMNEAVLGRPMLGLSKVDIRAFLESQQLTWREDSSNNSDKYKRNRVRNELLPLMADIVGGERHLAKRLDHLMEQSAELRADLEVRASMHLEDAVLEGSFLLPESPTLNLVEKEALHRWATQQMVTLPYDQLQRICRQLQDYPTSQQWTLHVGSGWNVVRNGKALDLQQHVELPAMNALDGQMLTWVIGPDGSSDDDLVLRMPSSDLQFSLSTAGKVSRWLFTPSWRVEHRPIKLKDFLRGQKIPLHLREHIPIIYVRGTATLVAVQVDDAKWIVDAAFDPAVGDGHRVRLILPVQK